MNGECDKRGEKQYLKITRMVKKKGEEEEMYILKLKERIL